MLLVYKQLSSMIRWWVLFVVFKQNNIITYHYHTYISPLLWIYHTKPLKDESLALIKYIFIVVIQTSASLENDLPCGISMLKPNWLTRERFIHLSLPLQNSILYSGITWPSRRCGLRYYVIFISPLSLVESTHTLDALHTLQQKNTTEK